MSKGINVIFFAVNIPVPRDFLMELADRFDQVYPDSGLPGELKSDLFPFPLFVNRPVDSDCSNEEIGKVIECYKEHNYCRLEFGEIAKSYCLITNFTGNDTTYFVFIAPKGFEKHGFGSGGHFRLEVLGDNKELEEIEFVTVRFGRIDAIISTVFHEIYAIMARDNGLSEKHKDDVHLHCKNPDCFMNVSSSSLRCCEPCRIRLEEAMKKK